MKKENSIEARYYRERLVALQRALFREQSRPWHANRDAQVGSYKAEIARIKQDLAKLRETVTA